MNKELTWFQQSFESGLVTYNVLTSQEGQDTYGTDYSVSADHLQSIAENRGKSSWDEDDIILYHLNKHNQQVIIFKRET